MGVSFLDFDEDDSDDDGSDGGDYGDGGIGISFTEYVLCGWHFALQA